MRENADGVINTKKHRFMKKIELFLILTFYPVATIGLFVIISVELYKTIINDSSVSYILFIGFLGFGVIILIASLGWVTISNLYVKYEFFAEGIRIKYLLKPLKFISWEEFQQVCICYADYTTRGPRKANSVICFVKKGEKRNGYGRWKTENPFRYKSVITMDYTDELYEEIKEKCPYDIPDLRKTRTYRL